MKLKDKAAIVTGAATGIGLAIALKFAQEGAKVVIADIREPKRGVRPWATKGFDALAVEADVASEDGVDRVLRARRSTPIGTVDILVNNAAIASGLVLRPFEKISRVEFERMLAVNTIGPFLCIRAVAPIMRAKKWGRIINMTSGTAFKGAPFMTDYVASKGAVMTMTRSLARELGPDFVTVNAVSPDTR